MYPSMLSRGPDVDIEPYYCLPVGTVPSNNPVAWSQPTSPTPPNRFGGPLSPTHGGHRLTYPKKNDDGKLKKYATECYSHYLKIGSFF